MINRQRSIVGALTLSAAAFVGIANHEAFRGNAYDDGVGVQTIGFGTTEGVKKGDTITVERALVRALTDVGKFEGALKQCVKVPLFQYEYDAYVSFSYNVGSAAFCSSTMVKKLNAGDYAGACAEFDRWACAKKVGGPGRALTDLDRMYCPTSQADAAKGIVRFRMQGLANRRADERKKCEGK